MRRKAAYTTGEVAKLLRCSQGHAIRCIDSGVVRGFRIPGSRFRKVTHEQLVEAATRFGIELQFEAPAEGQ